MLQVLMRFVFLELSFIPMCQPKKLDSDTSGVLDFSIAFDIVTGLTSYKNKQIWVRALFSCILCLRILILAYKRSQKFTIVQLYVINSTANPQYFLIYFCK